MIYLASASPRRHELLQQAGIAHTVLHVPSPPGEDEPQLPNESPQAYVSRTAHEKALRALHWLSLQISHAHPQWPRSPNPPDPFPVLTADTAVILGDEVLGKPKDSADAAQILRRLSGTVHEVHTAIVLAQPGTANVPPSILSDVSRTQVRFKTLTEDEIAAYCASEEPMGKAGAYGIQGRAALFVKYLQGSYSGVVGLPLFETAQLMRRAKIEF